MIPKHFNKKIAFVLTNLSFQAVIGYYGVYGIAKSSIAELFHYSEDFLGILDGLLLIGFIFGSFFTLFWPINPIRGLSISGIFNGLLGLILFAPRHLQNTSMRDLTICICFFLQAFTTASLAYTQVIFSYYYNENSEPTQHSIWFSLTFLGDLTSVIFAQIAISSFGLSWEFTKILWNGYIILIAFLCQIKLDYNYKGENELQELISEADIGQEGQGKQKINHSQKKKSLISQFKMLSTKILQILSQKNISFVILSFGLVQALYTNLLFWVPYYYIAIGYRSYSLLVIVLITISISFGGMAIEILIYSILKLQRQSNNIKYILIILSFIMYGGLWIFQHKGPNIQILFIVLGNLLISCPYSRISSIQPIEQCNYNQRKIKITFLLAHLCRNLVTTIFVVIIGFLMKSNYDSFWDMIMINVGLVFLTETIRRFLLKKTQSQKNQFHCQGKQLQMKLLQKKDKQSDI